MFAGGILIILMALIIIVLIATIIILCIKHRDKSTQEPVEEKKQLDMSWFGAEDNENEEK